MIHQVNFNNPPSHFSSDSQEYKNKVTTYPDKTVEEVVKVLLEQQSTKQAAGTLEVNPSTLRNYVTFAGRLCKGNANISKFTGWRSILDKIVNKYKEIVSKDPSLEPKPKPKPYKNQLTTNPNETIEEAVKVLLDQQTYEKAAKTLDVNARTLESYLSFARKKLRNDDKKEKTDLSSFRGKNSLLNKIVNKFTEIVSKDPSLKPEWVIKQNSKPDSKRKRKLRDPSKDEGESNKSVLLPKTADASDKSGKKRKISDFNEAEKKARLFGISLKGEPQWVIDHFKTVEQDFRQVKSSLPETDEWGFYNPPEPPPTAFGDNNDNESESSALSEFGEASLHLREEKVSSHPISDIPKLSTSSSLNHAPSRAQFKKVTPAIVLNSNITTSSSISSSVINFFPSSILVKKESKEERFEDLSDNPFEPISNFKELIYSDLVDAYLEWTSKATKTIDTSVPVETRMPTDYPLLMIDALVQLPKDQNIFAEKYGFNARKFGKYKRDYNTKNEKSPNSSHIIIKAAILINELNQEKLALKVSTIPTPAAQEASKQSEAVT